jgi:hypothetical protein
LLITKEDGGMEEDWSLEDLQKEERKRAEVETVKPKRKRREDEEFGR